MQLRCLAILNPHKGIDYCCSILLQYTGIDVMETAKTIALRKEFLPSGPEPFMSDERPTELNLVIQRIMVENITLFYPMDAAVGMSLIWNTVLYAQVSPEGFLFIIVLLTNEAYGAYPIYGICVGCCGIVLH
jgi:hypothetical protein